MSLASLILPVLFSSNLVTSQRLDRFFLKIRSHSAPSPFQRSHRLTRKEVNVLLFLFSVAQSFEKVFQQTNVFHAVDSAPGGCLYHRRCRARCRRVCMRVPTRPPSYARSDDERSDRRRRQVCFRASFRQSSCLEFIGMAKWPSAIDVTFSPSLHSNTSDDRASVALVV